jgi:hypothetical protein
MRVISVVVMFDTGCLSHGNGSPHQILSVCHGRIEKCVPELILEN